MATATWQTLSYDDVAVGAELPVLAVPITVTAIVSGTVHMGVLRRLFQVVTLHFGYDTLF